MCLKLIITQHYAALYVDNLITRNSISPSSAHSFVDLMKGYSFSAIFRIRTKPTNQYHSIFYAFLFINCELLLDC